METASSEEQAQVDLSAELDTLYQLCCDEDAAASACSASAVSKLPCFSLSPDDTNPEPSPPPSSPSVSLPTPLLAHIAHVQSLCAESASSSTSLYSVLLARLLHLLPQSATPLSFRLSVVQLLSLLMLPPASTAASCQSFFSSHLYRIASLLLPLSLLSSSVAAGLLRLVDGLLASGGSIGRSVCINVRKYVDGWKDEHERRRRKQQTDDTTAYFAAGGEVATSSHSSSTLASRADVREEGADSEWEGGVIVAGKRRRRIEPDPSIAALFPSYPTADDEDKRATALIEQLRAEQKVALTEKKLRAKDDSLDDEWRKEWRRWMEDEDDDETVEQQLEEEGEAQTADASETRKKRFWRQWEEGTEWSRFLPSSLTESKPRSSRPLKRTEAIESKESSVEEEEASWQLSAAEQAQVQAAAARRQFSSTYFNPLPVAIPQPTHFVHPSRAAAAFPSAFHQAQMGLPFVPPFVAHEQSLHPSFAPSHAFRGGGLLR